VVNSVQIWIWDDTLGEWVKQQATSTPVRMDAVGLVIAGQHNLCWLSCNPSAGNSVWELTDAIVGGAAVVLDCFSTARESKMGNFNPPIHFATGIYLETFTNMTSITFGYT